jgi:hypothetical protein
LSVGLYSLSLSLGPSQLLWMMIIFLS